MPLTREQLLDGAFHVLDDGDDAGALTIDGLAGTLRMSKSTLYKHFEGKDSLIDALVDRQCAVTDREVAAAVTSHDPATAFAALATAWARHVDRIPRGLFLGQSRLPKHARVRMHATRDRFEQAFVTVLGRASDRPAKASGIAALAFLEAVSSTAAHERSSRGALVDELAPALQAGLIR